MKHSLIMSIVVLTTFLIAQFIGIAVVYNYIDSAKSKEQPEKQNLRICRSENVPPLDEKHRLSTSLSPFSSALDYYSF